MDIKNRLRKNKLTVLCIFAYSFLLTMQNVSNPVSERVNFVDSGIYQYIGHLMTLGKMPYKDVFDHKGPLLYLINALGSFIGQNHGIYFIDLSFMIGILCFSYLFARKFADKPWALFLCAFIYSDFPNCYTRGNMPDYYALLFIAAALYFLSDYYFVDKISAKKVALIGICAAAAFWLKQTSAVIIFCVCLFISLDCAVHKRFQDLISYIAFFAVGFLPITLLLCGWIFLNGAGEAFIRDYFWFNFFYANHANGGAPISALSRVHAMTHFVFLPGTVVIWIMSIAHVISQLKPVRKRSEGRSMLKMTLHCVLTLIVLIMVLAIPGTTFDYYQINLLPILLAICAATWHGIRNAGLPNVEFLSGAFFSLALSVSMIPSLSKIPKNCASLWSTNEEEKKIIEDIQKFSAADETVLIPSGMDVGYYLASQRESATIYAYVQGSMRYDEEFLALYSNMVKETKPSVILWRDKYFHSEHDFFKNGALDDYVLADTTKNHRIYALKERLDAPISDASP